MRPYKREEGMLAPFRRMLSPILLLVVAAALQATAAVSGEKSGEYTNYHELNGKRIGILTGTVFDYVVNESLDYTHLVYFDDLTEMFDTLERFR